MKKIKYWLCLWLVGFTSCDKLPQNDELDGMWHLQKIMHLDENNSYEENVLENRYYWNFQLDLMLIMSLSDLIYEDTANSLKTDRAFCRFDYSNGQLFVHEVYLHFDNRDSLLTDRSTTLLERYGIVGCSDTFDIEKLNNKHMILVSENKKLFFRKF